MRLLGEVTSVGFWPLAAWFLWRRLVEQSRDEEREAIDRMARDDRKRLRL